MSTKPAATRTRRTAKPAATEPTAKAAPAPAKPAPAPANCACGCGAPTITAKALFVSGHDARLAGVLGRALAAAPADEALGARVAALSPALQKKAWSVCATATRKAAEKEARVAAKEAAKAAYEAALATAAL